MSEIYEAIEQLSRSKGIEVEKVIQALEEAIAAAAKRNFRSTEDIVARFDRQTGEMHAFARKTVVDDVQDEESQLDVDESRGSHGRAACDPAGKLDWLTSTLL